MNELKAATQAQQRYAAVVTVYAMLHTSLTDLNDEVHFFKRFTSEELITLQRQVSAALQTAMELKNSVAKELDATDDPR